MSALGRPRVGLLAFLGAAFFVTTIAASGCNAILGNELGGLDAGLGAADSGEAGPVACDVGKKSCGALGCQSVTDPQFGCGGTSCDTCVADHAATTKCFSKGQSSQCGSDTCRAGYDNCDSDPTNGCEAQSSDVHTCGGSGACQDCTTAGLKFCAPKGGGTFECSNECAPPSTVCNNGQLCVDLSNDVGHCGACTTDCRGLIPPGTPTGADAECKQGVCVYTCPQDAPKECHGHCVSANIDCGGTCAGTDHQCPGQSGCFAATDIAHCGDISGCVDCNEAAPPNAVAQACASHACVFACQYPFFDCDGDLQKPGGNGCEVDASKPTTCGGCKGVACTADQSCCAGATTSAFVCQPGLKCGAFVSDGGPSVN